MSSPIRLSELSDKELEVLHGNAVRLSRAGNEAQQSAAASLLPEIVEELSRRSAQPKAQAKAHPAKAPARKKEAKRVAIVEEDAEDPRAVRREPLVKRLPDMTDGRLLSLQRAATRISKDPEHSKHGSALTALPLIDAEIGRRAASLADAGERPNAGRRKDSSG